MSDRGPAPDPIDLRLDQVIADSLSALAAGFGDDDRGWREAGSKAASDRTPADLADARRDCRRLLEGSDYDDGNEFAIGAADNRANYAVGEAGLRLEAGPAPRRTPPPALVDELQQFLDAFGEANDLPGREAESVKRGDRDGEWLVRLFQRADGIADVRWVEPERLVGPTDPGEAWGRWAAGRGWGEPPVRPDWHADHSWGVATARLDRETRLGYWVEPEPGCEPEWVPEAEIVHCRFNAASCSRRGWPTFKPVARALRRAEELLVAGTAAGKNQAKISIIEKVANLTRERAEGIRNRLTTAWQHQPDGSPPKQESTEYLPFGAKLRIPAGNEVVLPNPADFGGVIDLMQANLRAAAARLNMPEWMFTTLADAKYSNAFVVEAPSLRMFRALQGLTARAWGSGRLRQGASVVWRAVRLAVKAGVLPAAVLTECSVKATAPSLETRDKGAETSANVQYINAGVKPVPLVQQELGYDPQALKDLADKYGQPPAGGPAPAPGPAPGTPANASGDPTTGDLLSEAMALADLVAAGWQIVPDWELVEWLAEARDTSKLRKVVITNKAGRKQTVYVKPHGHPAPQRPRPGREDADAAVVRAATDPAKMTAADVEALAGHLDRLPAGRIAQILRDHAGTAAGRGRGEAVARLLARVKAGQPAAAPAAPPSTPKVDPPSASPKVPRNVRVTGADDAEARGVAAGLFGSDILSGTGASPPELLAAAANAGDGAAADFVAYVSYDGTRKLGVGVNGDGYQADRTFKRDAAGNLVVKNNFFRVAKVRNPGHDPADPGSKEWVNENPNVNGTELLANQVRALRALGVKRIDTDAARSDDPDPNDAMNGYYTWPRLGYDAEIPPRSWDRVPPELKRQVESNPTGSTTPRSILDLMATKAGRDWWKANGVDLKASFDLADGSLSMRTLESYLQSRAAGGE